MQKIGEVAEKTGISIRSLRHYDEIGLLKPSGHSESGYRLYSKDDILRLQQIVSLKQMKIPLKTIRSMLEDDSMTLKQTLQMQQAVLKEQLNAQQKLCARIDHLLSQLSDQQEISLESVYETIEVIKMLEKYYTAEQMDELAKRDFHQDPDAGEKYEQAWTEVFEGLQNLQNQGVDPKDERTKEFALKAKELVQHFIGDNKGIKENMNKMYEQEGGGQMLRNHGLDVSDELFDYYHDACHAHIDKLLTS